MSGMCHEKKWCPINLDFNNETFYLNPNIFSVQFRGAVNFPNLG